MKLNDILEKVTSPKAYALYAGVGVIVTTVLTVIATRKECKREAEKSPEEKIDKTDPKEIVEVGKTYAPVVISAAATLFFIAKSNNEWQAYNSIINSALISSEDKMTRYRSQVPGVVAGSLVSGLKGRKADEGKQWYCIKDLNPYGDIYFQATEADIYYAELHFNRNFKLRGSASVREFAAFLSDEALRQIDKNGDYYGWEEEYFYESGLEPWIDFEHWHTQDPETGETINMISFSWPPYYSKDKTLLAYGYGA